jgi:ammonium transporter, Amt family
MPPEIDTGTTAWILMSAALVLLMTPGLALFYGGMVRAKSVLNMMMMSFGSIAVVSVLWVLYGYSLTYGGSVGGVVGDFSLLGLDGLYGPESVTEGLPDAADVVFQMMFAVITVALISGAIADRARFGPWLVFAGLWVSLVYFPVAHWVWASGGWIGGSLGAVDFAGGTAVHVNAGAAALALALVLGRRVGWRRDPMRPHSLPLVLLGAALLWFGWFGFNGGSAYAADATASLVLVNTQAATAAAILGWVLVEKLRDGHATTLGAASGVVAGLVAITPSAAALTPVGSIAVGAVAGAVCALAVSVKYRLGYDDSLDVVGVHLVAGLVGSLSIGLIASAAAPEGTDGLLLGGGATLLGRQVLANAAVIAYSFVVAYLLALVIEKTIGFRVAAEDEVSGIDLVVHAESGYDLHPTAGGASRTATAGHLDPGHVDRGHADRGHADPAPTAGVASDVDPGSVSA